MTDPDEVGGNSHIVEMMVNNYFHRWECGDDGEYLKAWARLRQEFPTLSGDPPPKRWMGAVREWVLQTQAEDPEFRPVCLQFSTSVIDTDARYERGPQWDGSPEQLSARIMPLKFTASDPQRVLESYQAFMLDLVHGMLPELSVDALKGDGVPDAGETTED